MVGLTSAQARLVLVLSVSALLWAGVVNVLLAVTESVLWPLVLGVAWTVVAIMVVVDAEAALPSRSRTRSEERVPAGEAVPVRPW